MGPDLSRVACSTADGGATRPASGIPRAVRLLLVVLSTAGVLLLMARQLGGLDGVARSVGAADVEWVTVAALAASSSYVGAGIAQLGGLVEPLPLGRLVTVQVACAFTNRLLPAGLGGVATNVRYLRRAGLPTRTAGAAAGLTATAGVLSHVLALAVALPVLLTMGPLRHRLGGSTRELIVVLVLVAAGALLLRRPPEVLRRAGRALRVEGTHLRAVLRDRSRLVQLSAGSLGVTAAHAAALVACLHAVGATGPVTVQLAVYVVAVGLAGVVPVPGGVGALETTLVEGLAATGTPTSVALTGVLVFRLLTFWLPALPGAAALVWLARRGLL